MSARLLLIHCLSPLHAGTGQSIGAVDLPIAREVSTGFPYLPGSSIKGSLRDAARHRLERPDNVTCLFGPETAQASDHAGALAFGDGRLVCMPVRSVHGTFAWATSPHLLQRLWRDATEAGLAPPDLTVAIQDIGKAHVTSTSAIAKNDEVLFEDLNFTSISTDAASGIAAWLAECVFDLENERDAFQSRFVVLHDDAMSFLSRHAVDTVTRASIDHDTKTVKRGQLWTEENLPAESILVSLVAEIPVLARKCERGVFHHLETICEHALQFGGHATIGRGRASVKVRGGNP